MKISLSFCRGYVRYAMLAFLLSGTVGTLMAQPPVLLTQPNPPQANQPFAATLRIPIAFRALGVDPVPAVQIAGNTIRIPFDMSCPFLCAPVNGTVDYPFQMPALPAGNYSLIFFVEDDEDAPHVAELPLSVVAGAPQPSAVPGLGKYLVMSLALLLAFFARRRLV